MKRSPAEDIKKELERLMATVNALEVSSSDGYQKSTVKVLRGLLEGQKYTIEELDHLKKAIDLVTLQLFEVQKKLNSRL